MDNLIIDYYLLKSTSKILKLTTTKLRLLLASLVGALSCFLYPLMPTDFILINLFKIVLAVAMLKIAFKNLRFKQLLLSLIVMLLVTYALGGMLVYFYTATNIGGALGFESNMPFGVCILACVVYSKLIEVLIGKVYRQKKLNAFKFNAEFTLDDKTVAEVCFLDSGNNLLDQNTQKPVTIITYDLLFKLTDITMENLIKKDVSVLKNAHYQKVATINGVSDMLIFEIDVLKISSLNMQNVYLNVPLGLTYAKIKTKFDCNALLNAQLIEV